MSGALLAAVLPASVASSEIRGTFVDETALFPSEARLVHRAVSRRRREFAAVRACARTCLARLGEPAVPVLHDSYGAPVWPAGVVGSMTHCVGFAGAALASTSTTRCLGIDAEPNEPLASGLLEMIASAPEIQQLPPLTQVCADKLLFSAKEAAYKALYFLSPATIDFLALQVTVRPDGVLDARHIEGSSMTAPRLMQLSGRWYADDALIVTAFHAAAPRYGSPGSRKGKTCL